MANSHPSPPQVTDTVSLLEHLLLKVLFGDGSGAARGEKEEDVDVHKYTSAIRCFSAAFFLDKGKRVEIQHPINELSQWVETGDCL